MVNFADLPSGALISICNFLHGDGHAVWKPQPLVDLGIPAEYIESVTHTYESDGSYKGSIFNDSGDMLVSTTGVYGLTLYRRINADLGLPSSTKIGRGFEAMELDRQIREHLKK